jgi:uncharacterized protein YjdB
VNTTVRHLGYVLLALLAVGCGKHRSAHDLRSIALAPSPVTLAPGGTVVVTATGMYSDGSTSSVATTATWSSSDATVATVGLTPGGPMVKAVKAGQVTVTATVGSVSGSVMVTVTAAQLQTLAVAPASASIARGTTQKFTATGRYADGTTRDLSGMVSWSAADTTVAAMLAGASQAGVAQGTGVGQTDITATLAGESGSAKLTVTAAVLRAIDVTPAATTLPAGETQPFVATGSYSDGSTQDITRSVTWTSSDMTIATVSGDAGFEGVATAIARGSATITAALGGVTGSAALSVTDAVLNTIDVTPATASLPLGTTQAFTATGVYSDGTTHDLTGRATWSSSDATLVSVSNATGSQGVATAVAPGSVTITAVLSGVSGTATATATSATLTSIALDPPQLSLAAGLGAQVTATGTYSDGTTRDVTATAFWESSDATVLMVVSSGTGAGHVTGAGPGTATLTATVGGVSASLSVAVTSATLVSLAITPSPAYVVAGTSQQMVATGTLSDGTTFDATAQVTWASTDTTVASVSNAAGSSGMVAALSRGAATISASLSGVSASAALTVTDATLVSISISPASPSVPKGVTQTFAATGLFTDGSTQDLTAQVTWTSSDPTVAAVSNATGSAGLATALAVGSTTITAAAPGGVSGQTSLTVVDARLVSISVSPANPTLAKGSVQAFDAVGIFSDGSSKDLSTQVSWSSSDATVVSVSNAQGTSGVGTCLGTGSATVTATLAGVSGSSTVTVTAAVIVSLAVEPPLPSLAKGTTLQLTAIATYSDATTQDVTGQVTWGSSDGSVATVSNAAGQRGLVAAVGTGTTSASAQLSGVTGATTVTVTAATLVSLALSPSNASLAKGTSRQLTATGTYSDGSTQDLTTQVAWTSSDGTIAAVGNGAGTQGLVTGVGAGTATISAASGGVTASTPLTVTAAQLVSISLSPPSTSLAKGTSQRFAAIGTYSDATTQDLTTQASWTSSDATVAAVSNGAGTQGLVAAVGVGSATVTATLSGVSGSAPVTVTSATLTSIVVAPPNPSLAKGTSTALSATGTYSDATTQDLTAQVSWASSDATVAAVSNGAGAQGRLSGVGVGTATISATLSGVTGSTTATVTSAVLVSISVTPPGPSLAKGTSLQLAATGTYSDGTSQDLTAQAGWSSGDPTIAAVSNAGGSQGRVTGAGTGSTTLTATLAGVSGSTTVTVTAATLVSIAITPPGPSLAKGTQTPLAASGMYSDGSVQDLTAQASWMSSDTSVAAVSNGAGTQGRVSGMGVGTATISATLSGVTGSTTATVTSAVLTSISVTPPGPSLAKGTSLQLAATGTYSDGTSQDLTTQASWSSGDATVAVVSSTAGSQGRVTGTGTGSTPVTATLAGVSGSTTVGVTAATLASIAITPPGPSLAKGTSLQVTATGTYSDGTTQDLTTQASWSSGDATVAVVSNAGGSQGRVTGAGTGSTTLTATLAGVSGSTGVTVTAATLVSIAITPPGPSLAKGTQTPLAASGTYSDGSVQDLTAQASWTSSDTSVAAVSNSVGTQGRLSGVGVGTATISATLSGVTGSTTATVTNAVLASISITPPGPSLAKGTSLQLAATGTYSDGTTQDLTAQATWSAGDATIAVVSNAAGSQGLVSGIGAGSTGVSATLAGVTGSTTVTITAATLVSIGLTPGSPTLASGTTVQLTATGVYSDSSTQDLTAQVAWGTSASTVATVSNAAGTQGLVSAGGVGTATITALLGGVSAGTVVTVTSATLSTIDVNPVDPTMAAGTKQSFTATGTFSDGSIQDLTAQVSWSSSNNGVVTVSNSAGSQGLVTAVTGGTANVTASLGGVSDTSAVTVTNATLTALAVTPTTPQAARGTDVQFTATGTFSDGSTQDVTAQVTWASSATTVASVSNAAGTQGLATGIAAGTTTISATLSGISSSTTMTVTNAVLVSVAVTPASPSLPLRYRLQFQATGLFSDGTTQNLTTQITWASSNAAAATISNSAGSKGLATGIALGTTTISATFAGVQGSTTLTVSNATLSSIAVTPSSVTLTSGQTSQLTATGTFSDGTTLDVTTQVHWTSSSKKTASVNGQGVVRGRKKGSATVSASASGKSGSTSVTVN